MRIISRVKFQHFPNYEVREYVGTNGRSTFRVFQDNVAFGRHFFNLPDAARFVQAHFTNKMHCLFDYM